MWSFFMDSILYMLNPPLPPSPSEAPGHGAVAVVSWCAEAGKTKKAPEKMGLLESGEGRCKCVNP